MFINFLSAENISLPSPGPNFIERLSRNEQDISHKFYKLHSNLAGNLNLVSTILLYLATFSVLKQLQEIGS